MSLARWIPQKPMTAEEAGRATRIPCTKPSRSQLAGSRLVAELAEQLAFSLDVRDFILQPIIEADGRPFVADALVTAWSADHPLGENFVVMVREDDGANVRPLDGVKIRCSTMEVKLSVLGAEDITTPYLMNVRRLAHTDGLDPILRGGPLGVLVTILRRGPTTIAAATARLAALRIPIPEITMTIERAVANKFVKCDLRIPFNGDSILWMPKFTDRFDANRDPIVVTLRERTQPQGSGSTLKAP